MAAAAPFPLLLLANPKPAAVTNLARQLPGTYIETAGKTFHVFPRAEKVSDFPKDALGTEAGACVWVRFRQLAPIETYTISRFGSDADIDVHWDRSRSGLLGIRPARPLPPGRYYATVARESIYGGEDFYYFFVRTAPSGDAGRR